LGTVGLRYRASAMMQRQTERCCDRTAVKPSTEDGMRNVAMGFLLLLSACSSKSSTAPSDPGALAPPANGIQLATTDVTLAAGQEEYVCWSFKVHDDAPIAMVGLDNQVPTKGVHHWAVFTSSQDMTDPGPFECETMGIAWGLVSGGGVGTPGVKFPDGTSMTMPAGQHVIVQLHLLNPGASEIKVPPSYYNLIGTQAKGLEAVGLYVVGTLDLTVPAHKSDVAVTAGCKLGKPLEHIFSVFPHMHQLGKRITAEILPAATGAASETLTDQAWGFADQKLYPAQGAALAGDQASVTCIYDNPGDKDVHFGLSTHDEMCFNVLYYYPAVDPTKPTTYCGFAN
jgi:hypothetical protein